MVFQNFKDATMRIAVSSVTFVVSELFIAFSLLGAVLRFVSVGLFQRLFIMARFPLDFTLARDKKRFLYALGRRFYLWRTLIKRRSKWMLANRPHNMLFRAYALLFMFSFVILAGSRTLNAFNQYKVKQFEGKNISNQIVMTKSDGTTVVITPLPEGAVVEPKYDNGQVAGARKVLHDEHKAINVPAGYKVLLASDKNVNVARVPQSGIERVNVYRDNILLAQLIIDFSAEPDFTGLAGDTDTTELKSYVYVPDGLTVLPVYTLFIPKNSTDAAVVICPDANSYNEVSRSCVNATILRDGLNGGAIRVVDLGQYWELDGVNSGGGISTAN